MARKQALRRWDVTGKHKLEQVEYKLPRLKAGEAHLEFIANGVCGSDTHMFCTGAVHSGHKGPHEPLTLGHEIIARVKRVGSSVTTLKAGDVVAVEPGLPCGTCPHCLKGRYHCCPKTLYMATPPQNGGLADEFYWPAKWCHVVPDAIANDPVLASLAEPLAACKQSLDLRNKMVPERDDDEWTVITGTGAMALGVLAVIKAVRPDEKVMVIARNEEALQFATDYGADKCFALSQVNPNKIAQAVRDELADLVATDHFDHSAASDFPSAKSKAGKLAMEAALEAVRAARSRGAQTETILNELHEAARKAAEEVVVQENTDVFKAAQKHASGFISSVFECTGDERLLVTLINSRALLANGTIIGLGCHYAVSFDIAMLRRFELSFQPVRRSCQQFPSTLKLLSEKSAYFRRLVGGTVDFNDFGDYMAGKVHKTDTGSGGPKTVVLR